MTTVHLVVLDTGGIHGAYLDPETAHRKAKLAQALVCEIPPTADYRNTPPPKYELVHDCGASYPSDKPAPLKCTGCEQVEPKLDWREQEREAEPGGVAVEK